MKPITIRHITTLILCTMMPSLTQGASTPKPSITWKLVRGSQAIRSTFTPQYEQYKNLMQQFFNILFSGLSADKCSTELTQWQEIPSENCIQQLKSKVWRTPQAYTVRFATDTKKPLDETEISLVEADIFLSIAARIIYCYIQSVETAGKKFDPYTLVGAMYNSYKQANKIERLCDDIDLELEKILSNFAFCFSCSQRTAEANVLRTVIPILQKSIPDAVL